jgi:adenylate cyclase
MTTPVEADSLVIELAPGAPTDDATAGKADETELAFWDSITDSKAAADYNAYLERYPTGNFSALARARLADLSTGDAVGTAEEVKLEIAYWESVKESDDVLIIRSYLEKYPDGHFKELAAARVEQLRREKEQEG